MIKDSLAKFFKVDSLISNVTGYVETRIELLKVEAQEEISKSLSSALVYGVIAFTAALVLIFFSIGVGIWISNSLGGFVGFSIVAGFYLLVTIVLIIKREALTRRVENEIRSSQKTKK